jgi:hypothetical protein
LNRYGSSATRNRRMVLRTRVQVVWTGRTDIISVKRNQIWIRIRKLKPNPAIASKSSDVSVGGLLIRTIAPIERARPKTRSVSDSILGRGRCP